jgi:membrane fusion protein (multidrug efflux system)
MPDSPEKGSRSPSQNTARSHGEAAEVQEGYQQGDGQQQTDTKRSIRPRSFFREHPRAKWILLGLAVVAAIVIYFVWNYFAVRQSTDDAQIDGYIIPVSARVPGYIQQIKVKENEYVKAGTVLIQIDPADYQVAVESAKADLAEAQAMAKGAHTTIPITSTTTQSQLSTAEAAAEVARAGVVTSEKEIDAARARYNSAEAQLRQADANYLNAKQNLDRYKLLIAKDEISQQQYDTAVTTATALEAAVDAAQAGVTAANQQIAVAESHLVQAKARLAQAQAEVRAAQTAPQRVAVTKANAGSAAARVLQRKAALDRALLDLQYTTVKAPVDGVISKKTIDVGVNVQAGQPILALVPLEDIWVKANYKETELTNMRPGQRALITVDTYSGHTFHGYVESIAAATGEKFSLLPPENATGNYVKVVQRIPVRIRFNEGQDPQHILRPGMSVEVTVITK